MIDAPDGPAEAYLTGAGGGPGGGPGVLLFVDAIGLRPQIEQMADRMAGWGCTVLAPHVFYRDGTAVDLAPAGGLRTDEARAAFFSSGVMERVAALTAERAAVDAEAWVRTLTEHADGPIGTVGYCMGARLAVRLAGQLPGLVVASAGFHGGGLVTDAPDSPHVAIAAADATFAFGHADQDGSMPAEAVATLEAALVAAGHPHTNEIYVGAPHGYSMADTSAYDEAATERHFAALRDLFATTLGTLAPGHEV